MTEFTIILILLCTNNNNKLPNAWFLQMIIVTGELLPKMETYEISVPNELVNDFCWFKTDESTKTLEDDISVEMEKFPLPQKLPPTLRSKLSPIITAKMATK